MLQDNQKYNSEYLKDSCELSDSNITSRSLDDDELSLLQGDYSKTIGPPGPPVVFIPKGGNSSEEFPVVQLD